MQFGPQFLRHRSDGVRLPGTVWRGLIFLRPTVQTIIECPACRGQSRLSGFCCAHRLCVRSPCQHISRMRTFDNNSCAISITSPRSLFRPRTQHGRWGHREKSRWASTRWDCRGKVLPSGTFPLSGTPSERRVNIDNYGPVHICSRYTTPAKCSRNKFSVHEHSDCEHCEMFSVPLRSDLKSAHISVCTVWLIVYTLRNVWGHFNVHFPCW